MEGKRHRRGINLQDDAIVDADGDAGARETERRCARIEGLGRRRVTTIVLEKLQFLASNNQMTVFFHALFLFPSLGGGVEMGDGGGKVSRARK